MYAKTKIICTIGPSVATPEKITDLMLAGMSVARLNFSHGTHEEHLEKITMLKQVRHQLKMPLAIMLDTKGPEFRIGKLATRELYLAPKSRWLLVKEEIEGDADRVTVKPGILIDKLDMGTTVLFDDGYISSKVVEITNEGVYVQIENGGVIKGGRGVNVPDVALDLPALTEKDIEDIEFGCLQDIDLIAASFIQSADHVLSIKELLAKANMSNVQVISKIESASGVHNIDQIIQVSDGIMIARGDLGVELPLSKVPRLQKMMIHKCCMAGKPSITATQMLESMIHNPRPTRAETSDVANAIYDSTSGVMLSGETAVGDYPVETVDTMKQIVEETEKDFNYRNYFENYTSIAYHDVPSAVSLSTVKTAYSTNAKAIFAFTSSGSTARSLSRFRPSMPIIAMTSEVKTYQQLAFVWGVIPFLSDPIDSLEEAYKKITAFALENGIVDYGDLVIVTAGTPFGVSGTTNMMMVKSIGDILVRGYQGLGPRKHGKVMHVLSPESKTIYDVKGHFIVINRCGDDYRHLVEGAAGVILENSADDYESEEYLKIVTQKMEIPVIFQAIGARNILKEGALVTMEPEKSNIYNGVVF